MSESVADFSETASVPASSTEIVYDAYEKVQEDIPEQRIMLENAIESACSNALTEEEQRITRIAGGMVDWLLFAKRGAALPTGLLKVRMKGYDGEINRVVLNPTLFDDDSWRAMRSHLGQYGLDELINHRSRQMALHNHELKESVRQALKASPIYRLMQSFDVDSPQQVTDQPLTQGRRAVRETQIEAEIRQRYRIPDQERIYPRTHADYAWRHAKWTLDDETMPRQQDKGGELGESPFDRARAYFTDFFVAQFANDSEFADIDADTLLMNGYDGEFYAQPRGVNLLSIDGGDWSDMAPTLKYFEFPKLVFLSLTEPNANEAEPFSTWIGCEIVMRLFDVVDDADSYRPLPENYQDFLNEIIEAELSEDGAHVPDFDTYQNCDKCFWDNSEIMWLKDPPGPYIYYDDSYPKLEYRKAAEVEAGRRFSMQDTRLQFVSKENMLKAKQIRVGEIAATRSERDGKTRLIQTQPRIARLPRATRSGIVFETTDKFPKGQDPYIPGYTLVGRDEKERRYSFEKGTGDPYVACRVKIPADKRDELIEHYQALGLYDLAQSLGALKVATVSNLTDLIRNNSTYIVPTEEVKIDDVGNLDVFSQWVQNGMLQTQCTGSAHFLRLSLDIAFGKGSAGVTAGFSFNGSGTVDALGHAQTVFRDGDYLYIQDATPGYNGSESEVRHVSGLSRFGTLPSRRRQIGNRAMRRTISNGVPSLPAPHNLAEAEKEIPSELPLPERIAIHRRIFEQTMQTVFRSRDTEQLYKVLITMPSHDPSRRAMELFAQATSQEFIDPVAIDGYLRFVESIARAPAEVLKELKLENYKPDLINMLKTNVGNLLTLA